MHRFLSRQLERHGLALDSHPEDTRAWREFIEKIDQVLGQADDDRALLERSLALSSEEMGDLHSRLADERDTLDRVICSLDEGVCAIGAGCTLIFINPEASRLLRLPSDGSVVGKPLSSSMDAMFPGGTTLHAVLTGETSPPPPGSRLTIDHDDSVRIECTITALARADGHLMVTLRDVTVRDRLETERAALNRQLLDVSRRAGMAEVATCVLHNVGNILNSVNVSATMISERARASEALTLAEIAALLPEEPGALSRFVTDDARGRLIPSLLRELGAQLGAEQAAIIGEVEQLVRNIDHIREVVSSQQSFARSSGIMEDIDFPQLVGEAIRLNEQSLQRHGIEIVTEIRDSPRVHAEASRVLQVLVNLIANAKHALEERDGSRCLRIRLDTVGPPRARRAALSVIDNGEGIDPAHLDRLFEHGFTTRSDGHGFGLHYCALTAQQLDGSLSAHSEGPGCGATFVLELPAAAQRDAA